MPLLADRPLPNPFRMATPTTRNPAMPSSRSSRSGVRSGVRALVSQAYPPYIHHSTPNTSSTWAIEAADRWLPSSSADSCVRVNAKTRSKNSSSVLTRSGGSVVCWSAGIGQPRAAWAAAHSAMSVRNQPPRMVIFPAAWYAAVRAAARSGPVPTTLSTRPPADTS